jgi:hypothetical protein
MLLMHVILKKNINCGRQIITPATVDGLNHGGQVRAPAAVNTLTAADALTRPLR